MAQNVIINGSVYADIPYVDIPHSDSATDARFWDNTPADFAATNLLTGKTAYGTNGAVPGSMPNNGATGGTISNKNDTVTIPSGYTSGGTVELSTTAKNAIVSGNIKKGASIMGVSGSNMVVDTTVSTDAASASTIISGYKAYVNGAQVTGTATVPTVTQDSTTHALRIF